MKQTIIVNDKQIIIDDKAEISDNVSINNPDIKKKIERKISGGVKKTCIKMIDHETGKVLQEGHNKILVPGSQSTCCKQFGIKPIILFDTYNKLLGLDNSEEQWEADPDNDPIVCLFAVGRDGALTMTDEIAVVMNTDRIEPTGEDGIVPFRYVDADNDLTIDQREQYFGRKVDEENNNIFYYFKAFDTEPQLHIRYLDGTEVSSNMYDIDSSQAVEVYVEFRLSINRQDCREYFDKILGWDKADISTLSLLTAWYESKVENVEEIDETHQITYKWYQDIIPFSKWNFEAEGLTDLTKGIDFIYQVYY